MPNYQGSKKHISNWGQIVLVLFAWDVLQKSRLNTIPQCGWILYVAHRPLCGQILDLKKEDLRGGYSPPNPFTACHQRRPPSFPFPPSDPDDSKVVDVAVEEVETVVVEEQGPDDSPPRPSSGSPKWQELPLKVAFYSTTGRVIFQMPALTLGHISNVNIVLRT